MASRDSARSWFSLLPVGSEGLRWFPGAEDVGEAVAESLAGPPIPIRLPVDSIVVPKSKAGGAVLADVGLNLMKTSRPPPPTPT